MAREQRLYIGTRKGAFILRSCDGRASWQAGPPALAGWNVNDMVADPRDPDRVYAAANHDVWGPMLARSTDGGRTWTERTQSPAFPSEQGISVAKLWVVRPGHPARPGEVWAGADPGALFRSGDWGASWEPVAGLNEHPTREGWMPGGGGLCLHGIDLHPSDPSSLIVTISAGGAFRTDDGGASWQPINRGVRAEFLPDPDVIAGHCVHHLVRSPSDPNWLFQQNHCGMYRSPDGGASWQEVSEGLPSGFGFPSAVHPHEPRTVYVAPLEGDTFRVFPEGAMVVWRSRDGGDHWQPLRDGLPRRGAYMSVMRSAMTTDREQPAGVYIGTSNGQVFASADDGDNWRLIVDMLPPVLSIEASAA